MNNVLNIITEKDLRNGRLFSCSNGHENASWFLKVFFDGKFKMTLNGMDYHCSQGFESLQRQLNHITNKRNLKFVKAQNYEIHK